MTLIVLNTLLLMMKVSAGASILILNRYQLLKNSVIQEFLKCLTVQNKKQNMQITVITHRDLLYILFMDKG